MNRKQRIAELTADLDLRIELLKELAPKMEIITLDELDVIATATGTYTPAPAPEPEPTPEPELSRITFWEVIIRSALKAHYADRKAFRTAVRKMAKDLDLTYVIDDGYYHFFPEDGIGIQVGFESEYDVTLEGYDTSAE